MEGKATNILVDDEVVARATISKKGTNISIVKVKNSLYYFALLFV